MNDIEIKYQDNHMLVSSVEVARNFGKNHKETLRDIRKLLGGAQNCADLFYKSSYIHEQNKQEYPMYLMNRDGFSLLVMGFTGKEALEWKMKYIEAFNQMEKKLNDPEFLVQRSMEYLKNRCDALLLENKAQSQQIAELKPKALFADAVATSHTSILVGELAKILKQNGIEMGQKRLFAWLREKGYLIKRQGTDYNMPTQKAMELGLFEIKEGSYVNGSGVNITTKTPKITGKGQQYFINKFLAKE